jgi:rod shape-determining protein MreC
MSNKTKISYHFRIHEQSFFKTIHNAFKRVMSRLKPLILVLICILLIGTFIRYPHCFYDIDRYVLHYYGTAYEKLWDVKNWWKQQFNNSMHYINAVQENARLQQENIHLKKTVKTLIQYKHENRWLKDILWVVDPSYDFLTTKAIAMLEDLDTTQLIIAAGSQHGVQQNNLVLNNEGVIGRVIFVEENYSKVMTINDPKFKLHILLNDSNTQGIAENSLYKDWLKVDCILDKSNLKPGIVVTAGNGIEAPYGLYVGEAKLENDKVYIHKPKMPLDFVTVVRSPEQKAHLVPSQ